MNVFGIGLWIVMVASPTARQFADALGGDIAWAWEGCRLHAMKLWALAATAWPRS